MTIGSRNEYLAAFEPDHGISTPFTNTAVIAEIKRSLAEDGEFIDVDSDEYRAETKAHIASLAGTYSIEDIMPGGEFDHTLHEDILIQIHDYVVSREDSILEGKAMDAVEKKKLLAVGFEIGIDFSVVEVWAVDLQPLSIANMVKLPNRILYSSTMPNKGAPSLNPLFVPFDFPNINILP